MSWFGCCDDYCVLRVKGQRGMCGVVFVRFVDWVQNQSVGLDLGSARSYSQFNKLHSDVITDSGGDLVCLWSHLGVFVIYSLVFSLRSFKTWRGLCEMCLWRNLINLHFIFSNYIIIIIMVDAFSCRYSFMTVTQASCVWAWGIDDLCDVKVKDRTSNPLHLKAGRINHICIEICKVNGRTLHKFYLSVLLISSLACGSRMSSLQ